MKAYPLKLDAYKKGVVWGGTTLRDKYGKSFALCADGVKYTVDNPKKKNITQLEFVMQIDARTDKEIQKLVSNH